MRAILVVDDDPQVLEVVGEMLRLAGYIGASATLAKPFARSELIALVSDLSTPAAAS